MAHDVDVGERQKNKEEKPVTIEFFPHVKPFVFFHKKYIQLITT